jgi:uncharacterized protein with PQ loop repeat
MVWQDTALTIAVLFLNYALIPQIIKTHKTKKALISIQTATITAIGMATISITYLSLNLFYGAAMNAIAAILWAVLLIQSITYKK